MVLKHDPKMEPVIRYIVSCIESLSGNMVIRQRVPLVSNAVQDDLIDRQIISRGDQ